MRTGVRAMGACFIMFTVGRQSGDWDEDYGDLLYNVYCGKTEWG